MKYQTIFFVVIVQLIYVCESWKLARNGIDSENAHLTHELRTSRCPWLHKPKFAKMSCISTGSRSTCTAQCLAHHVFNNTVQSRMTLQCGDNNRWIPRPKFPDCVSNGLCKLTTAGTMKGKITCKTDKAVKHCTINCEGTDHGWFTCKPSGRWSRPLPKCVEVISGNGRMGVALYRQHREN